MNYQITRIRLASVGPEPARFDPLDLVLTKGDGTGPADTVLFLPNTGGKTVLLRLLFSVLHPPIVDRIGSEEVAKRSRNLAGYVLERDTSHVIIEWRRAIEGRFVDDEALLTGLVVEWRGGRPTTNPSDLVKLWYSIRGPVDLVSAQRLILETDTPDADGVTRRRIPLRRYAEQVEEFARQEQRAGVIVVTEYGQQRWMRHLDDLGLDRAIFRYQGEMNHNEAGASAIARFAKDLDFIEFFLNAVMDPDELAVLDRQFEEVADKVRRYPEYERRVRFEEAALAELEPLAVLVEGVTTARHEVEAARSETSSLLARFSLGAKAARAREETARARHRDRDNDARRLTVSADRSRDEWRAFRQIGAKMWLAEASEVHDAAQQRTARSELDVQAWAIAEELVRLEEARSELRALDDAYAIELERLRPLQLSRDDAARALCRRLTADLVLAGAQEVAERQRTADARKRASDSRDEQRDSLVEAATLDATREGNELRLGAVTSRRNRLVAEGYLEASEASDVAHRREEMHAAASRSRIDAIDAEIDLLEAQRALIDETDDDAKARETEVQQHHGRVATTVARAAEERARLIAEPLILELTESDAFDLELIGPAVAERLLGRATEADVGRLDLELRGAEDQRALRGLDQTGFLPPPPDVVAALTRLSEAGVSGAMPGTRYIADAIAEERRASVVGRRPELAGGIILTDEDDLALARAVLETASLDPSMIIAVGSASDLVAAENAVGEDSTFVIPPADAVWDRPAATAERARRESRLASLDKERSELDVRAKGARSLSDALTRHATEYPAGWLTSRTAERDALGSELDRLAEEHIARQGERSQISETVTALRREATDHRRVAGEAERRVAVLARLVDEETETADLGALIERQRADVTSWRTAADVSGRAAVSADAEADEAAEAAQGQKNAAERIRRELATVALADSVPQLSINEARDAVGADTSLPFLRASFDELDRRLKGETSASDIAARRSAAIRSRDRLNAAIELHSPSVRARAVELVQLPEAGELAGRRAAADRADSDVASARRAEREAYAIHERAKTELNGVEEEIRVSRRTTKISDDRSPRDRHHAARLAAEARQAAETTQAHVATAERERNAAREDADSAKALADALEGLATQLRMVLNLTTDAEDAFAVPYDGDTEEARVVGLKTSTRLTGATTAVDRAEKAWRTRDSAVRTLLTRDEFSDLAVSDRLYRRLVQSPPEVLARDAADLVADLRASIGILRAELGSLVGDMKLATTSLAKTVNKALSYLRLAEMRSKMPATLRDWAGAPFLIIRFDKPPGEELEARLSTFTAAALNQTSDRPTGTRLLLQALERAVGTFSVQILKPNESFALIRVPIVELSSQKFSNGQRSTVATALMLMLSELRRQSRSAQREASVGALLLDNPFGNANAGFLIEVQRTVAAAAGIQLIYTTGIADLNALRRFPVVIALSNDGARRSMRRYVRANPALLELLVPSDDAPGGRLSASRVVRS